MRERLNARALARAAARVAVGQGGRLGLRSDAAAARVRQQYEAQLIGKAQAAARHEARKVIKEQPVRGI